MVTIFLLERNRRITVRSGYYFSSRVAIDCLTNCTLNFYSKCNGDCLWHLSSLIHDGFPSAICEVLTSAFFKQQQTLSHWFRPFQIWIMRSPLHVDLWCVFSRWSSCLPGRVPCRSHHFSFGQIWWSHQPSSLFPSVMVYQLALTTTISILATWAPLSTVIKILAVLNQKIFNQQSLCHYLL